MNILSISDGSERSTHAYLPYMAEAAGQEMLLCDLCIDGCSLEQHWDNWRKELPCYEYDICLPGETDTRTVDEVALHEAVEDEEWDVITLRQSRSMSGVEESYLPYLAELAEYCRMMQPKAKIMLIQPWTYDSDSADPSFRRLYGGNQNEMYRALTESCAKAAIESDIDIIVPIGKAFQIARQTPAGSRLTCDGYDGNELGCYLAGACLYEAAFGKNVTENGFTLPAPLNETVPLLKLCAQMAAEKGILR